MKRLQKLYKQRYKIAFIRFFKDLLMKIYALWISQKLIIDCYFLACLKKESNLK